MREKIVNFWYKNNLTSFFKLFLPLEKIYAFFSQNTRKKIILLEKAIFAEAKTKPSQDSEKLNWRLREKPTDEKLDWRLGENSTDEKTDWRLVAFATKKDWLRAQKLAQRSFVDKNAKAVTLAQANRHIRAKIPLIIVGNLTLGGTGKTPVVANLTKFLQNQGLKVAIISRGYGGKAREFAQKLHKNSSYLEVGDEALMLFNETGAEVFVDKIRARALDAAIEAGAEVIISDDGLQHLGLVAQIKILVIDGMRAFGNGHLLPLGPLREEVSKILPTLDFILQNVSGAWANSSVNKEDLTEKLPQLKNLNRQKTSIYNFKLAGKSWTNGAKASLSASPFSAGTKVNALAAIGNPDRFFADLRSMGLELIEHRYGDHQRLNARFLQADNNHPWVMTAKDGVKLTGALGENHWIYGVEADIGGDFQHQILHKIKALKC